MPTLVRTRSRPLPLLLALLAAHSTASDSTTSPMGDEAVGNRLLEEVYIFGDDQSVRTLPGSAALITPDQIRQEFANDINQLLKTVPGTYIREEDGYGLRPNIGIRGATSERSSKITLMEDGVMIAPAPYSNPSAYYFPTAMRMQSVEVLKGAPLLRYGPQTTGGIVNMISTPIPEQFGGNIGLRVGQNQEQDLLANIGGRSGNWGYLVETAQRRSDGFKDIDRGNDDSGFEIQDYLVKVSYEQGRHALLLKAQYSDEISNETYLGLTDRDFQSDSVRRYGLSAIDVMNNDHTGLSARYGFALNDDITITTLAYHNSFARNWFKLSDGGDLVHAANQGDIRAQGILDGTVDAENLGYKNNNRDYDSSGVELNVDHRVGEHQLAYGARIHRDTMDRYQPEALYDQINGSLVYAGIIEPTGSNNRLEDANALSAWITDTWQFNDALTLNLAMRVEDVESSRRQYSDPDRATAPTERGNSNVEWLPGVSAAYQLTPNLQVLAGVHRGVSPLGGGAQEFEEPETSVNYEAGLRFAGDVFVEAIAFYSDFDNKTENCSNANPCSNGATAGAFTTGEAVISGLEMRVGTEFGFANIQAPLDIAYTYTDARVSEDNLVQGFADGDQLASVPGNALSIRLGLETAIGWNNYLVMKYIDEMCVSIGCNQDGDAFNRTDDLWVTDLVSRYAVDERTTVFAKIENVFDEQAIVSREPDGARPNKPFTASLGVQYTF